MAVPLLDPRPQNLALESELCAAFRRVLRSGQYILGPELEAFEAAIAETCATRHAIGVSSGTDALLLALMTLGIGPGDEVLVPSFTFFATAGCVSRTGATPVFTDVCPVCFNMDPADAARRVTPRTRAIVPVHLFGQAARMDPLRKLAADHDLRVIEDGAQALGATCAGVPVGALGDFGAFSFFPTKNLGGFGDSGLLVTNDGDLADKARLLRVHGARPKYYHHVVGANFRMDPLQAALLAVKLPHYRGYSERRRANAADYTERLSRLPGVTVADPACCRCPDGRGSADQAGVRDAAVILPVECPGNEHIWNQYTLRVTGGRRDALREHLAARGVASEIYYPVPMHAQPCFRDVAGGVSLPVSERLASEVLSIPIYPELTAEQRAEVVDGIASFLAG